MNAIDRLSKNGYIGAAAIAYMFHVSRQTVYNWINAGWIPATRSRVTFMYEVRTEDINGILAVGNKVFKGYPKSRYPELVFKYRSVLQEQENNG